MAGICETCPFSAMYETAGEVIKDGADSSELQLAQTATQALKSIMLMRRVHEGIVAKTECPKEQLLNGRLTCPLELPVFNAMNMSAPHVLGLQSEERALPQFPAENSYTQDTGSNQYL